MSEEKKDDVIEIKFEDLGLTKPLEKMTAKELREMCMEKIPQITGVSGMTKEELLTTIRELFGLEVEEEGPADEVKDQIKSLKAQIGELKKEKAAVESRKEREILRRKISRLKKRTRRLARSA